VKPSVIILDANMPDMDGFEVCRRIKQDPSLSECRVMLSIEGIVSRSVIERASEAQCDDLIVMPAVNEEFFSHLADLLGVPRRASRRVKVELMARLDSGTRVCQGTVEDISLTGARISLQEPLGPVQTVRVRIEGKTPDQTLALDARVVRRTEDGLTAGLEFLAVPDAARRRLEALVLFEIVVEADTTRVFLDGDFTEATSFAGLLERLEGQVDFDAAGVRYVNSQGSRRWTAFLRDLTKVTEYTFSRCSLAFTTQASMLPQFLGRGRVISFHAPYHCNDCEHDEARLLQASALVREGGSFVLPRFRCSRCGGQLLFDEIPERYLSFLG